MNVGGDISLFGCYTMQIPSWMKNLPPREDGKKRSVMLYGTRISQQDIDDLKRAYDGRDDIHIRREQAPFASAESQENLEILGFAPTAQPTEHEIKKAWHKISLEHHPDKSQEDGEIFKTATEAKEKLLKRLADWNR
jgi:DnaJ-domain-containing protein 1